MNDVNVWISCAAIADYNFKSKTVVGAASKKSLLVAGAQMHIFSTDVFIFARVVKLKPKRTQVDSTNSLYTVLYKMTLQELIRR